VSTPHRFVAFLVVWVAATAGGPTVARAAASEGWLVDAVRIEPLDPADSRLAVEGLGSYRGIVELRASGGRMAVINEVGLEDYVRGIVEVPPAWPAAALEAQAVAARTYALNQRARTAATPWRDAGAHLCPTDACQVYQGIAGEEREGGAAWVAAVEATAGQVLLADGQPILAEYSSSNGGRSSPGSAWYLRAVNDPHDAASPLNRWSWSVPLDQLAELLGVGGPGELVAAAGGGGAIVLTVKPPDGEPSDQAIGVGDFVSRLSGRLPAPGGLPLLFPSWAFDVSTDGGHAVVVGGGWGHGRGMSQWGAYGKAKRGWDASEILAAYYGGIVPEPLPAELQGAPLRVAIALGWRSAAISADRPSRVVEVDGAPLASVALGRWTVAAEGGRLRVQPPEGFDEPMRLASARLSPRQLVAGGSSTVRFNVSAPAVVRVEMSGPGVEPEPVERLLVDAGETTVRLPRPRYSGYHRVTIDADAGPGRRATTSLVFRVQGQSVYGASVPADGPGRTGWIALACLLAAAVGTGLGAFSRGVPTPGPFGTGRR
jgi:stage II sporulation protein D